MMNKRISEFVDLRGTFFTGGIVIETGGGQVSGFSPNQYVFKYHDDMRGKASVLCVNSG